MNCDNKPCPGHLGKFSSCRDEALYELSMDSMESTGDMDHEGEITLVILTQVNDFEISWYTIGTIVRIEPCNYIVQEAPSGIVNIIEYATEDAARSAYAELATAYGAHNETEAP
jgi:hypothetical protein